MCGCVGREVYGLFVRGQERTKDEEAGISGKRKKDEQIVCTLPARSMITCAFLCAQIR